MKSIKQLNEEIKALEEVKKGMKKKLWKYLSADYGYNTDKERNELKNHFSRFISILETHEKFVCFSEICKCKQHEYRQGYNHDYEGCESCCYCKYDNCPIPTYPMFVKAVVVFLDCLKNIRQHTQKISELEALM